VHAADTELFQLAGDGRQIGFHADNHGRTVAGALAATDTGLSIYGKIKRTHSFFPRVIIWCVHPVLHGLMPPSAPLYLIDAGLKVHQTSTSLPGQNAS
jgi:hypothetical protein